jgi:CRP/FNR family transcriptional regulator, cyclic AMP receptor protein
MGKLEDLRLSPLFHGSSEAALTALLPSLTEHTYQAGDQVVQQDAAGAALFLLVEGTLRVSRESLAGRERVLGFLYAPAVMGETAVLIGGERSATVTAVTEARLLMLYGDHLLTTMRQHPELIWNLARILAERVNTLNDELIASGISTEVNLAHVLRQIAQQQQQAGLDQPNLVPLSSHELTLRLSSSRETVSRLLRRLEQFGLVRQTPRGVLITDPARLEALLFDVGEDMTA